MFQRCWLFKWCRNLPEGHCVAGVQAVKAVSEPTCLALCYRVANCFSVVGNYLPGLVLQGCRLFKGCWNLPAGYCEAGVQAVLEVSEPTWGALYSRGAGC